MDVAELVVRLVLAAVFVVAAVTKILDRPGTLEAVSGFGIPHPLARPVAFLLPLAEFISAALLIWGATAWFGGLAALLLVLAFSAGIAITLARGEAPDCHCFGQLHSEPIGWRTLARNGVLLAAAVFVLIGGTANRDPGAFDQLGKLSAGWWVGLVGGTAAVVLLGVQVWYLIRIARRNEQVLIRIKMLEADLRGDIPPLPFDDDRPAPGLAPGAPAPFFELPDTEGNLVSLDSLRAAGKPLFLLFTSPSCAPCNALMPDIGEWQREHADEVEVVVISSGRLRDVQAKAAEHRLTRVLVEEGRPVDIDYKVPGTPGAVLIRQDGTIGSPVAMGETVIRWLLQRALQLMPEGPIRLARSISRPPPITSLNGSGAAAPPEPKQEFGRPAPELRLPDLDGRMVDLAAYRGERVLALYWSTDCGYCGMLLPELLEWEASPPPGAPRLVLVAKGDVDALRTSGLHSRILLDQEFETADVFGINGTPLAALIDDDGTYLARLAGGEDVLSVLRGELWAAKIAS